MITKLTTLIESNNISIDSLQIRIPLILCELNHRELKEKTYLVSVDGEQIGTIEPNKHISNYSGITVIYKIKKVSVKNPNTGKIYKDDYLCIGLPSKVLKSRYLEGITATNLENVYEYLDSLKVASFDYKAFEYSLCTDIDYKLDFNTLDLGYSTFDELTKDISLVARPTQEMNLGYNRFSRSNNKGIQFQKRENTHRYMVFPFLKFYSKRIEMLSNKNRDFKDAYLVGQEIKEGRVETTLKGKEHLRKFGITDTSLTNLVSLDKEKKEKILLNAINRNIVGGIIREVTEGKRKMPVFDYLFCLLAENKCMTLREAMNILERQGKYSKQVRYNLRKKLDKLELHY